MQSQQNAGSVWKLVYGMNRALDADRLASCVHVCRSPLRTLYRAGVGRFDLAKSVETVNAFYASPPSSFCAVMHACHTSSSACTSQNHKSHRTQWTVAERLQGSSPWGLPWQARSDCSLGSGSLSILAPHARGFDSGPGCGNSIVLRTGSGLETARPQPRCAAERSCPRASVLQSAAAPPSASSAYRLRVPPR